MSYPAQLPGAARAPQARTLIDILHETAQQHPDSPALDDGEQPLSYSELIDAVKAKGRELHERGLGAGDKLGVRIQSGTRELYVTILAIMYIGAAYVPVDADDPQERADLVFTEAGARGICETGNAITLTDPANTPAPHPNPRQPTPQDDCWVIFTSGSTGTPKGVAVTHRSAAAFVDAEARIFLQDDPLTNTDRVLAGLSVAFDASCEEMWLAWRHGACLVPAPRSLVRSGVDLGPWLIRRGITAVSTVPTLAALWPAESLEQVRLLIFGGEACPPELAERLATEDREVWNTYGPTEATVVACAAPLTGNGPVRIGLPLDGWDLAVVDKEGIPVAEGENGELIIGGVGLARYLDPAKDAEKYAPMPTLGWERAYRSGDIVTWDPAGLIFIGRADEQVKLGGRRIELGEVDAALQSLPGVHGAAAAVKKTPAGSDVLVGYLVPESADLDLDRARERLSRELPAALIPLLTLTDTLPTKTSGKVDRSALPWPLQQMNDGDDSPLRLDPPDAWIAERWSQVLGAPLTSLDADFFAAGGGSLSAAQLVSALRERYPNITVADIYSRPRVGSLIEAIRQEYPDTTTHMAEPRTVNKASTKSEFFRTVIGAPLLILVGMRWLTYTMAASNLLSAWGFVPGAPTVSWWWVLASWLIFVSPPGRMLIAVIAAKILLKDVQPGSYPRSGRVHLRLWLAEHIADMTNAVSLASAPLVPYYARALGAKIGKNVDLHSVPPVTGMLRLGSGCAIEPEVDLSGYWIDGDLIHIGPIQVGKGASVGARSTLLPGSKVGAGAYIEPGSALVGTAKPGMHYSGSPAKRSGRVKPEWPSSRPKKSWLWPVLYFASSSALACIPYAAAVLAGAAALPFLGGTDSLHSAIWRLLALSPLIALVWFLANALLIAGTTRLLGLGLTEGHVPVRSRIGWQVWATERVLDMARDLLFPIYASLFTPTWLRILGAKVGKDVEASTVLLVPKMTTIGDGAFLADDTMVASYELGAGWMKVAPAKVGKRAFLGNSGMTAAGRSVPKNSLVAVLSATPAKAKAGTSWLGSPPVRLRRQAIATDDSRTYKPPTKLKVARGLWEVCRFLPVVLTVIIAIGVMASMDAIVSLVGNAWGYLLAALLGGVIMLAAGALAALSSVLAKWALVGKITAGEHPLWSSFIWRNEVVDTFVELVSAPWFARAASGTPALVWWLRALGAKIGKGVWCESYWLPEADLVSLGNGSTVNRGCVVQTHLFHDRVMSLDTVTLQDGSTMGPHSVILPAATLQESATIGPASLVMRGESVPAHSYWMGNPVGPWTSAHKHLGALEDIRRDRERASA